MPVPQTSIGSRVGGAVGSVLPVPGGSAVGSAVGGLFGKRKRSSCRSVAASDVEGFLQGKAAPWVVWDRVDDFAAAWGLYDGQGTAQDAVRQQVLRQVGSYRAVAELHLSVFVPLCENMEGGERGYTTDPQSGPGLAIYNAAREAFRSWIRSGARGAQAQAPPVGAGGRGGAFAPGGEAPPQQAGFGGAGVVAIVGLGLLLAGGKFK